MKLVDRYKRIYKSNMIVSISDIMNSTGLYSHALLHEVNRVEPRIMPQPLFDLTLEHRHTHSSQDNIRPASEIRGNSAPYMFVDDDYMANRHTAPNDMMISDGIITASPDIEPAVITARTHPENARNGTLYFNTSHGRDRGLWIFLVGSGWERC